MPSPSAYRRDLLRQVTPTGWTITVTPGGHLRLSHPRIPTPVFASCSPGDHRALSNVLAVVRRLERQHNITTAGHNPEDT